MEMRHNLCMLNVLCSLPMTQIFLLVL